MLKGYERRIQEPGPSRRETEFEDDIETSDLTQSSIARTAQLISEAAQGRPMTKLLDPESLPRLDPPSHPFKRLTKPLKIPSSLEIVKDKVNRRKKKRPQPEKKWRKLVSREDNLQDDNGMSRLLHKLFFFGNISLHSVLMFKF